jgi:hypothetical protein
MERTMREVQVDKKGSMKFVLERRKEGKKRKEADPLLLFLWWIQTPPAARGIEFG